MHAGAAAVCLAVSAALLFGPDPVVFVLPLAVLAGTAAARPVTRFRMRMLLGAAQYRHLARGQAAAGLEAALRPAGLREVHVLAGDRVRGLARNYQSGGIALILILDSLLDRPDLLGFFVAHEAAHLARRDTELRPLLISTGGACWLAVALSWPVMLVTAPLVIAAFSVYARAMELSCDRLAARWVGTAAARSSLQLLISIRDRAAPGSARSRIARCRGVLTYPSAERRIAVVEAG